MPSPAALRERRSAFIWLAAPGLRTQGPPHLAFLASRDASGTTWKTHVFDGFTPQDTPNRHRPQALSIQVAAGTGCAGPLRSRFPSPQPTRSHLGLARDHQYQNSHQAPRRRHRGAPGAERFGFGTPSLLFFWGTASWGGGCTCLEISLLTVALGAPKGGEPGKGPESDPSGSWAPTGGRIQVQPFPNLGRRAGARPYQW